MDVVRGMTRPVNNTGNPDIVSRSSPMQLSRPSTLSLVLAAIVAATPNSGLAQELWRNASETL